jgi:hypothetical protein
MTAHWPGSIYCAVACSTWDLGAHLDHLDKTSI